MDSDTAAGLATTVEAGGRLPIVAIVGRPNVGKSMLFNRLVHAPRAIVDSQPGVTRDRNVVTARWKEQRFWLIDTGGFEEQEAGLPAAVRTQSLRAAAEADVVIAVFDGRAGLRPGDRDLVDRLRRLGKPVAYAVNKLDTPAHDDEAADFFALGSAPVLAISAAHGRGVDALMEYVLAQVPAAAAPQVGAPAGAGAIALAIIGRPNVGKSSLLNRIVGEERAIVDAVPGTTRDPLDIPFRHAQQDYVLVDTAGIRRRPRVDERVERASAVRALRALERAEVAILVIDAREGMTHQDARIAGYAQERGRALLLAANKWDAVPRAGRDRTAFARTVAAAYPVLADIPVLCLSARTGAHVNELFARLAAVVAAHRREVRTVQLNRVLAAAVAAQAPPSVQGKRPRFYYATQTGTAPPAFTIFSSAPRLVPASYLRYLSGAFREAFALQGTPLRLLLRPARRERTAPGRRAG